MKFKISFKCAEMFSLFSMVFVSHFVAAKIVTIIKVQDKHKLPCEYYKYYDFTFVCNSESFFSSIVWCVLDKLDYNVVKSIIHE